MERRRSQCCLGSLCDVFISMDVSLYFTEPKPEVWMALQPISWAKADVWMERRRSQLVFRSLRHESRLLKIPRQVQLHKMYMETKIRMVGNEGRGRGIGGYLDTVGNIKRVLGYLNRFLESLACTCRGRKYGKYWRKGSQLLKILYYLPLSRKVG